MYLCMMSVCPQLTVLSLPRPGSSVLHSCHRHACQSHWVLALGKHAHMSDICGLCLQYALEMLRCLEVLHMTGLVGAVQNPAADGR